MAVLGARNVAEIEGVVRAQLQRGDVDRAATAAIEGYGPELHGYLLALAGDHALAGDAFSLTCEQLWRGLPGFRWEALLRTWAYRLAHNALATLRQQPQRRAERNLPLSAISSVEAAVRTSTATYQRTDVKDALRALRDALDPVDRELLILRLDRGLPWRDIALAVGGLEEPFDPAALTQRAAALRKRFERAKDELRALAVARNLIER